MYASAAWPQTAPSSPAALPGGPPSGPIKIFPLSEVHRGLHGVAYTVFQGTQPEAMNVEIMGVLYNSLGPGQDMILARLTGSKPEYTGVVAGMSGSPVYIDGKLVGALAYRIGQFTKEPIAGITPIAQMLAAAHEPVRLKGGSGSASGEAVALGADRPLAASGAASGAVSGAVSAADSAVSPEFHATAVSAGAPDNSELRPIDTPLVFSGFSEQAVKLFGDRFRALGLTPVAGLGGSALSGSSSAVPNVTAPLEPGSAVSALLVDGDLQIAATCTVTMVEAGHVLACGHPITQLGDVSLPMTKADVVATVASPLNAFKVVNTAQTIGAFTQDRVSAIDGLLGGRARMIPVAIHIHGSGASRTLHMGIVDDPTLTPSALTVSLYNALTQTNDYGADLTYAVHGDVQIDGYPALKLDSFSAPTEQVASAARAATLVGQRFARIYANRARVKGIRSIDIDVDALPGRRSMEIESVQASQPAARPGDTVMLEATLRPYQGEPRNLRIPVRLPPTLPAGRLRILLSDGATLDRLTNSYPGIAAPSDLSGSIQQLNAAHAQDVLYVSLLLPDAQAVVDGHTLQSIPLSMANVLEPLRSNREMSLNGESVVPVTSIPVDAMLTGQQVVSLDVE